MKIKDYGLASFLLCRGHRILDYTRDSMGRVWFRFSDDNQVRQGEIDFQTKDATVNVQDYLAAQRRIKSLIFETNLDEYGNESTSGRTPRQICNPN